MCFLAVIFLLISLPMLASSPQVPDGAELVMTALHGGVLHPPGFPLQSWVDRAVIGLSQTAQTHFNLTPAWVLSALSLLFFSGAIFFLGLTLRRLGVTLGGACFGVICFAFFAPTWQLAVQPEKYALLFLLMAAFSYFALNPLVDDRYDARVVLLGVLFGLIYSQHVVGLVALPLVLETARQIPKHKRLRAAIIFAGTSITIALCFYLSLFMLTQPETWPDWGKLHSLRDLLKLALREDLGFFSVDPNERTGTRAIEIAYVYLMMTFSYGLLLVPLGLWLARRKIQTNIKTAAWAMALIASIGFIIKAKSGGYPEVVIACLERFVPLPMFFLSFVFSLTWDSLFDRDLRQWRWVAPCVFTVVALVLGVRGRRIADASTDGTLDFYSRALGPLLPANAVYVGGNDLEYFYGAQTANERRFPLIGEYDWYRERVMPRLESRFEFSKPYLEGSFQFENVKKAYRLGLPVYSTDKYFFEPDGPPPTRRGLFWVLDPRKDVDQSHESVRAALSLCSSLKTLSFDPPKKGHLYSKFLWQIIALSFMDTSDELKHSQSSQGNSGENSRAEQLANVANTLGTFSSAAKIKASCEALETQPLKHAYFK
jgi:Protein of unknown function (DUF2723)